MTTSNVKDVRLEFCSIASGSGLDALVGNYLDASEGLACLALLDPPTQASCLSNVRQERVLLDRQRQVIEQLVEMEIETNKDMVAMLEIWQSETVESNDQMEVTERLVLTVLKALKKRT